MVKSKGEINHNQQKIVVIPEKLLQKSEHIIYLLTIYNSLLITNALSYFTYLNLWEKKMIDMNPLYDLTSRKTEISLKYKDSLCDWDFDRSWNHLCVLLIQLKWYRNSESVTKNIILNYLKNEIPYWEKDWILFSVYNLSKVYPSYSYSQKWLYLKVFKKQDMLGDKVILDNLDKVDECIEQEINNDYMGYFSLDIEETNFYLKPNNVFVLSDHRLNKIIHEELAYSELFDPLYFLNLFYALLVKMQYMEQYSAIVTEIIKFNLSIEQQKFVYRIIAEYFENKKNGKRRFFDDSFYQDKMKLDSIVLAGFCKKKIDKLNNSLNFSDDRKNEIKKEYSLKQRLLALKVLLNELNINESTTSKTDLARFAQFIFNQEYQTKVENTSIYDAIKSMQNSDKAYEQDSTVVAEKFSMIGLIELANKVNKK